MKELNSKLAEIQQNLNAPKNLYNSFGKYKYRNCEGILEAVKPLLGDLTLIVSDEIIGVLDRVYVRATATLSDGEHEIKAYASAREAETKKGMDEAQITGAASSYARMYALNGLLAIDDTKDADDTNKHESPSASQIGQLMTLLDNSTLDDNKYQAAKTKIDKIGTMDDYYKAKKYLESNQRNHIDTGENYSQTDIQKQLDKKLL